MAIKTPNTITEILTVLNRIVGRFGTLVIDSDGIYAHTEDWGIKVSKYTGVTSPLMIHNCRALKHNELIDVSEGVPYLTTAGVRIPLETALNAVPFTHGANLLHSREVPYGHGYLAVINTRDLAKVSMAASVQDGARDNRYKFVAVDPHGTLVATDGARLALVRQFGAPADKTNDVAYLPKFTDSLATKFGEDQIEVSRFTQDGVAGTMARFGTVSVWTYLTTEYLNYLQLIPSDGAGVRFELGADQLLRLKDVLALAKANKATAPQEANAYMYLTNGLFGCEAPNMHTNNAFTCDYVCDPEESVRFDPQLFADGALATGMIPTITIQDDHRPSQIQVRGDGWRGSTFTYLLMPLRK